MRGNGARVAERPSLLGWRRVLCAETRCGGEFVCACFIGGVRGSGSGGEVEIGRASGRERVFTFV